MPGDDGGADRAGPRAAGVPARRLGARRHLERAVGVDADRISLVRIPIDGMLSHGRPRRLLARRQRGGRRGPAGRSRDRHRPRGHAACAGERVEHGQPRGPDPHRRRPAPAPSANAGRSGGRREDRRSHGRCRDVHRLKVVPATRRQGGGDSAAGVPGPAAPAAGASQLPRPSPVTPGDCAACQAGSHQSSGGRVGAGMGPVCPLYPSCSPSRMATQTAIPRHFSDSRVHPLSLYTWE